MHERLTVTYSALVVRVIVCSWGPWQAMGMGAMHPTVTVHSMPWGRARAALVMRAALACNRRCTTGVTAAGTSTG